MLSPTAIVRAFFAAGTVIFGLLGLGLREDPRWFAASGFCGLLWAFWGVLADHAFPSIEQWSVHLLSRLGGGSAVGPPPPPLEHGSPGQDRRDSRD